MATTFYLKHLFTRRMFAVVCLAFCSGLPLGLTGSALQAWFTVSHVDLITIGALTLVGQPYVYKFLWAPLFDRIPPPLWDRRRGWLLLMQLGLVIGIASMAFLNPSVTPKTLACIAVMVSFFSASQDTVFDAYRAELLPESELGIGSAFYTTGYRVAMLVSGGLTLVLADHIGWQQTYLIMASFMALGMLCTWRAPHPKYAVLAKTSNKNWQDFMAPFAELWSRPKILILLIFIVTYKIGDAFAIALITNFLIRGVGFSLTAVGGIYKTVGLAATLFGSFAAGVTLTRISLFRSLMLFGFIQAFGILAYLYLAITGKNYFTMVLAVFLEYFSSALGSVTLMVFLMKLCSKQYTASQYALFAAIAAIGRVFIGPVAGEIAQHFGWPIYFCCAFITALPCLFILYLLRKEPVFQTQEITAQ